MPPIVANPVISFLRHRAHTEEYGYHAGYRHPPRNIRNHKSFPSRHDDMPLDTSPGVPRGTCNRIPLLSKRRLRSLPRVAGSRRVRGNRARTRAAHPRPGGLSKVQSRRRAGVPGLERFVEPIVRKRCRRRYRSRRRALSRRGRRARVRGSRRGRDGGGALDAHRRRAARGRRVRRNRSTSFGLAGDLFGDRLHVRHALTG